MHSFPGYHSLECSFSGSRGDRFAESVQTTFTPFPSGPIIAFIDHVFSALHLRLHPHHAPLISTVLIAVTTTIALYAPENVATWAISRSKSRSSLPVPSACSPWLTRGQHATRPALRPDNAERHTCFLKLQSPFLHIGWSYLNEIWQDDAGPPKSTTLTERDRTCANGRDGLKNLASKACYGRWRQANARFWDSSPRSHTFDRGRPPYFWPPSNAVKSGPHQQQCRSNVRLWCQKRQQCRTSFALKFRPFDKVERCFDIVTQNGNNVEATGNKVACCFDIVASVDRA